MTPRPSDVHRPLVLVLALASGCTPDFGDSPALVAAARILAIQATPPEAAPGDRVSFRALVATPAGTSSAAPAWAYCTAQKPLTENDVVSAACLGDSALVPIDNGAGNVPTDACALFGPDVASPTPGQPPSRPRDPDATGGYYQPVRAALASTDLTFALERLSCGLQGASFDVAAEYRMRYQPNRNPTIGTLTAMNNGTRLDLTRLPAGQTITLVVTWSADSMEQFPVLDLAAQTLDDHTEAMSVSWFVTAGALASERSEFAEGDPSTSAHDDWTLPTTAGPVHLWVVLRDSRGGVDFLAADGVVSMR